MGSSCDSGTDLTVSSREASGSGHSGGSSSLFGLAAQLSPVRSSAPAAMEHPSSGQAPPSHEVLFHDIGKANDGIKLCRKVRLRRTVMFGSPR